MEMTETADPEHAAALQWVKSFMKTWDQIDPVPEDVDTHAVAALASKLYSRNMDLDAGVVAQREWEKSRDMSCDSCLS